MSLSVREYISGTASGGVMPGWILYHIFSFYFSFMLSDMFYSDKKLLIYLLNNIAFVCVCIRSYLRPKAERMTYWGQQVSERRNARRATMALIDQFFFVLIRLKAS